MQIQADMLFNGEKFTWNGNTVYTATGEPFITGPRDKERVHIPCKTDKTHTALVLPLGTEVTIQRNPVR